MAYRNYSITNGWIVSGIKGQGDYTTITSALAVAPSGTTIGIYPGTYTENFTLPAGVNLAAIGFAGGIPNVIINGKITMTSAGTSCIWGCELRTNSDFAIVVSGNAASILKLDYCNLNILNNTLLSYTSSSGSSKVDIFNCQGNIATTGITLFTYSSSGVLQIGQTTITNTGVSTTASTASAGQLAVNYSNIFFPITLSSTASLGSMVQSNMQSNNTTALTLGGSAHSLFSCSINSGSAVAVSISTTAQLIDIEITSSNTNAIGGAGTLVLGVITFLGSSSTIQGTLTQTSIITRLGQVTLNTPLGGGSGGTGDSAITDHSALIASGTTDTGNFQDIASVASGSVLVSAGTSTLPAYSSQPTLGTSNSGVTNTFTYQNASNTSSSQALFNISVGGATADDPFVKYTVSGVTNWSQGIDNSDSDAYVLAASTALGTTNVMRAQTTGEINYPLQSAFLGIQPSVASNVTGDGTQYTLGTTVDLTEIFDQNSDFDPTSGIFTAPVTGRYYLSSNIQVIGGTAITAYQNTLATSNRSYLSQLIHAAAAAATQVSLPLSVLADMDAADTCTAVINTTDTGGKIDDIQGGSGLGNTSFSGYLAC